MWVCCELMCLCRWVLMNHGKMLLFSTAFCIMLLRLGTEMTLTGTSSCVCYVSVCLCLSWCHDNVWLPWHRHTHTTVLQTPRPTLLVIRRYYHGIHILDSVWLLQIICVCWCQKDENVINNTSSECLWLHLFTVSGALLSLSILDCFVIFTNRLYCCDNL